MKQWEHKIRQLCYKSTMKDLLTKDGQEGWELVSVVVKGDSYVLFMKRELDSNNQFENRITSEE